VVQSILSQKNLQNPLHGTKLVVNEQQLNSITIASIFRKSWVFSSGSNPQGPKAPNKSFDYVDEVASDLRVIAREYEDPLQDLFFKLGNIHIRRLTNSQDFVAAAFLRITRNELVVDFVNLEFKDRETASNHKEMERHDWVSS
jgi:hypothetical protein